MILNYLIKVGLLICLYVLYVVSNSILLVMVFPSDNTITSFFQCPWTFSLLFKSSCIKFYIQSQFQIHQILFNGLFFWTINQDELPSLIFYATRTCLLWQYLVKIQFIHHTQLPVVFSLHFHLGLMMLSVPIQLFCSIWY